MKNLRTPVVCLCCMLISICSFSQTNHAPVNQPDYNKPKLFDALPQTITVAFSDIENLIGKEAGQPASVLLDNSRQITFTGTVVSVSAPVNDNSYKSVVIRSGNFNGAIMQLIRAKKGDGSFGYEGRIVSKQHGDAYILKNDGASLVFVKKGYYDLVSE
jgi:hypothetical protein